MLTPDQAFSAQKAQFAALTALCQRWLDCTEQLAQLQLRTGKAALTDCAVFTRELLEVRSPEHLLSVCQAAAAPMAEKVEAYCRSLYEIASSSSASWSQFAGEQAVDAQQQFGAAIEGALQHIPQGSDNAAALLRQALSTMSSTVESVQKAAMQAAEVADANLKAVTRTSPKKGSGTGG